MNIKACFRLCAKVIGFDFGVYYLGLFEILILGFMGGGFRFFGVWKLLIWGFGI